MTKTDSNSTKSVNESLVKSGSESIGIVLDALRRYSVKAAAVLDETEVERAESTANHLAQLGARMAQIVAELRKVEHHEQRNQADITPRSLFEYLRKLTPAERADHMREVERMDKKGSVLG